MGSWADGQVVVVVVVVVVVIRQRMALMYPVWWWCGQWMALMFPVCWTWWAGGTGRVWAPALVSGWRSAGMGTGPGQRVAQAWHEHLLRQRVARAGYGHLP